MKLIEKINNGRYEGPKGDEPVRTYNGIELGYKFIPAKINAYFALQCSASIPVPWPRVIVINDVFTKFRDVVRVVKDTGGENPNWPSVSEPIEKEIEINTCDGMGLISPEMSVLYGLLLNS